MNLERDVQTRVESKEIIPGEEAAGMMLRMEQKGLLAMGPGDRDELVQIGRQKEIRLEEARDFIQTRLTEEGVKAFEETVERVEDPSNLLLILKTVSSKPEGKEKVEIGEIITEPRQLVKEQGKGPSSLIAAQIDEQLTRTVGETGKVPLRAWVLNPRAGARVLTAIAREATARAGIQEEISRTAAQLAKRAGESARRDALRSYASELEESLGQHVEGFCQKNGLSVPEKNTLDRWLLLLRMNAEFSAVQARVEAITEAGKRLVEKQVAIQAGTARDRMLSRELPFRTEAAKEANAAKEELIAEKVRSALARIAAALSGGAVGAVGGTIAGIENSARTLVDRHPKVAIPLGAGIGVLTLQLTSYSGALSNEILQEFALKSSLVALLAAGATGVGAGLVARFSRRSEEQNSSSG